jgi:hypothetical protein
VIRTVWLGLIFMVVLAGVGSFRFAFGHFDVANASGFVRPDGDRAAGTKASQGTLASADPSPVASASPPANFDIPKASYITTGSVSRSVRANEMPRIVSRHWHEPDMPIIRQANDTRPKRKHGRGLASGDKSEASAEPKTCQLMDFDAIRRALNLPTGCHT